MKKYIISFSVVIVLVLAGLFYSGAFVSANPDYICVKDVINQPCEIADPVKDCSYWESGKSICKGFQITQIAYYHIRTSCEPGYYSDGNVGDHSNSRNKSQVDPKYITSDTTSSGRHSVDYPNKTVSCTVEKTDTQAPEGETQTDIIK